MAWVCILAGLVPIVEKPSLNLNAQLLVEIEAYLFFNQHYYLSYLSMGTAKALTRLSLGCLLVR